MSRRFAIPEFHSLGFRFEWEASFELPASGGVSEYWFRPPEPDEGGTAEHRLAEPHTSSGGVHVWINPRVGEAWVGHFLGGDSAVSGVFGYPDPRVCLVVASGEAYRVPVARPAEFGVLPISPVQGLISLGGLERVALWDHRDMGVWGPYGRVALARDATVDGFTDVRIEEGVLRAGCWEPGSGAGPPDLRIDLDSGEVTGGCVL